MVFRHLIVDSLYHPILTYYPVVYELDILNRLLLKPKQVQAFRSDRVFELLNDWPSPDDADFVAPFAFDPVFKTLPAEINGLIVGYIIDELILRKRFITALHLAERFEGSFDLFARGLLFPKGAKNHERYIRFLKGVDEYLRTDSAYDLSSLNIRYNGPIFIPDEDEEIPRISVSPTDFNHYTVTGKVVPWAEPLGVVHFAHYLPTLLPDDMDQPILIKTGPKVRDIMGLWGHKNGDTGVVSSVGYFDSVLILNVELHGMETDPEQFNEPSWRFLAMHLKMIFGPAFETMIQNTVYQDDDSSDGGSVIDSVTLERINPWVLV